LTRPLVVPCFSSKNGVPKGLSGDTSFVIKTDGSGLPNAIPVEARINPSHETVRTRLRTFRVII